MYTSRLYIDQEYIGKAAQDDWANAFARIENHYFVNEGFMKQGQLLEKEEIDAKEELFVLQTKLQTAVGRLARLRRQKQQAKERSFKLFRRGIQSLDEEDAKRRRCEEEA